MSNKTLIWVIVVLVLIILGFVGYYIILPYLNQTQTKDFSGGIVSAEFQVFPAGTELKQGMTGNATNIFKKDDIVTISGQSDVDREVILTIKIFDENGNERGIAWHGGEIKLRPGGFGFGSITIPQTAGNYTLKIYLNSREAKEMPFQIS